MDLRHVSGLGEPCTTTGPREGASEISAYSVNVDAVATYRESQERAPGVLAMRKNGHLRADCPRRRAKKAVDKHNWRTDGAAG
jgi:hypothetical protein